jgi:hypothetical protein
MLWLATACGQVYAQANYSQQYFENKLNQFDAQSPAPPPVSMPQQAMPNYPTQNYQGQYSGTQGAPNYPQANYPQANPSAPQNWSTSQLPNRASLRTMFQRALNSPTNNYPAYPPPQNQANFIPSMQPSQYYPQQSSIPGRLSRAQIMRYFFDGSSGPSPGWGTSASSGNSAYAQDVRSNEQIAQNEDDMARSSQGRSQYGSSYDRKQAAEQAQYHANAARNAADKAYSESEGGSEETHDYASRARNYANDAQYQADRARSNADSYTGQ